MRKGMLRLGVLVLAALAAAVFASSAFGQNYVVLYRSHAVPVDAAQRISSAGGALVYGYDQIGVAVASSDSATFRTTMLADNRVANVSGTAGYGVQQVDAPDAPVPDDPLEPLQWDMAQIHAPEAHAITEGSRSILVGDIDTGMDFTHPDLAPNYDAADSTDCTSGAPAPLPPGNDHFGHGTHTAGTIAAAQNGIGTVGVAPNVRIAAIKATNDDGFLFPEMIVCSFVWAGTHGVNVTNNSYFVDPWLFNCRNDPAQRAIWVAEQRAIRFAMDQGVSVIAAAGNFADDLSHPTRDIVSPDTGAGEDRRITNACAVIPVEIPGVVGVSADGNRGIKSYYSSYGTSAVQVTAPGGDRILQRTAAAPNGRVLSTVPGGYAYAQGTSMATPHVTGVAALIQSEFGPLPPGRVTAILDQTADGIVCPDAATLALYAPFPQFQNGEPQACQGGRGHNSWYGHGQVNALSAVTR